MRFFIKNFRLSSKCINAQKRCDECQTNQHWWQRRSDLERLPDGIINNEILLKLELDALCTFACVSKTLGSFVSQSLLSLTSLDLSAFSLDTQISKSISW